MTRHGDKSSQYLINPLGTVLLLLLWRPFQFTLQYSSPINRCPSLWQCDPSRSIHSHHWIDSWIQLLAGRMILVGTRVCWPSDKRRGYGWRPLLTIWKPTIVASWKKGNSRSGQETEYKRKRVKYYIFLVLYKHSMFSPLLSFANRMNGTIRAWRFSIYSLFNWKVNKWSSHADAVEWIVWYSWNHRRVPNDWKHYATGYTVKLRLSICKTLDIRENSRIISLLQDDSSRHVRFTVPLNLSSLHEPRPSSTNCST